MARTTRSAVTQLPESSTTPKSTQKQSKKRKRGSVESDTQPPASVKTEQEEPEELEFHRSSAGSRPIELEYASKILDVLEM